MNSNYKFVTKSWVRLLATEKLVRRPAWCRGKSTLLWMPATGGGVGIGLLSKGQLPPCWTPPPQHTNVHSVGRSCYRPRDGATCRNSTSGLLDILKVAVGGPTSIILIVSRIVNFQFQDQPVPISLRPVLGAVVAAVMARAWSSSS